MATLASRLLNVWNPMIRIVRTRTRTPNIRKPAIPHWSRAVVLKLIEPVYKDPEQDMHPKEKCEQRIKAIEKETMKINHFEQILAKEFREEVGNAKIVAIFHMLPITQADLFAARIQLNKINMKYLRHNKNIMRLAFTGTKYEALLNLNSSTTCTFVGNDPDVAKLLKTEKKISGLVLLGGVVDGRFMCVQDLKHYASLPSLHTLQAQLVSILNTPAQHLSQHLSANQVDLSSALSRYSDETKPDEDPETSSHK